jgi:hypothetical protein
MELFYDTDEHVPLNLKGRLLGLLDKKQFALIAKGKIDIKKLATGRTVSLKELSQTECKDLRLVFLVRAHTTELQNRVFISHPLAVHFGKKYLSKNSLKEVSLLDKYDNYLTISE